MEEIKEGKCSLNVKKLALNVAKLIVLLIVLSIGIPFVREGYQLSQEKPPPEIPISFEADMVPKAGPPVGKVKINLEPTEAFVIGDKITADIEVQVNWLHENETANVWLRFIDCLSVDAKWAWTNTSHYNELIFPEYNSSMATYSIYRANAIVWYTHEGIFGVNVTVYSPYSQDLLAGFGTLDGTVYWSFPEVVHIKSYSYLEERLNAQFTNALTLEIFGLTVITVGPVAVIAVDLVGKALESIFEGKDKENKDNKEEGKRKASHENVRLKTMSKVSELKEYIERKLMLAKLDSALLFFSSSLSLAFGVGYAFLGGKWLQYYLPMLFLGWFMPIYIGYLRGSLIQDSVEERARGWIYFVVGLGFYIGGPLLGTFVEGLLKLGLYSGILAAIPAFFVGYSLATLQSTVVYSIFKFQKKDLKEKVKQAFTETRLSALLLAILLMFLSVHDWSKFYRGPDLLTNVLDTVYVLILVVFVWLLIVSEKKARKLLRNAS